MWGRTRRDRLVLAAAVAVASACGGRSARPSPVESEPAQGGTGGTGVASAGVAGTSGAAGGAGEVLRPCGSVEVSEELFPPLILLLDGSARALALDGGGTSRWDAEKVAVLSLASSLRDGSRLGVAVARENDEPESCSDPTLVLEPAPLDASHRLALESVLARAAPGGEQVQFSAYGAVVDRLEALGRELTTANVVVVGGGMRAGEPPCSRESEAALFAELGDKARAAASRGISTFGVAIDGSSEEFSFLVILALEGRGACSLNRPEACIEDVSREPDVAVALAEILREQALRHPSSCRFSLEAIAWERPLDPDRLNFALTSGGSTTIVERGSEPCSSGWALSSDGTSVVLCPDTCEAFRGDASSTLRLAMVCDGPPPRN